MKSKTWHNRTVFSKKSVSFRKSLKHVMAQRCSVNFWEHGSVRLKMLKSITVQIILVTVVRFLICPNWTV